MADYKRSCQELIEERKPKVNCPVECPEVQNLIECRRKLLDQSYQAHEKWLKKIAQAYGQSAIPEENTLIDDLIG
ncbi:MAG: hypothetical protein ACPLZD_01725 [Candidatus Saccharicenans sp.]|nr:MAG: hypothetical protein C0168_07045 [Candidatus Aminicenantes bacterium]HEK84812.1 hypothetical protein [Candidatus Aminicenantes bacterium]